MLFQCLLDHKPLRKSGGAEWLHDHQSTPGQLIDDDSAEGSVEVIPYNPETVYSWVDGELARANFGSELYAERTFKNTS